MTLRPAYKLNEQHEVEATIKLSDLKKDDLFSIKDDPTAYRITSDPVMDEHGLWSIYAMSMDNHLEIYKNVQPESL